MNFNQYEVPPEVQRYEVPPGMQAQHNAYFESTSKNYEQVLNNLQLVLIVDRSGSMRIEDEDGSGRGQRSGMMSPHQWTRWDNTLQIVMYLAQSLFCYDKDGRIPLIFFGNDVIQTEVRNGYELYEEFLKNRPTNETTNLYAALRVAFFQHIDSHPNENVLFIVVTDGCPNAGQENPIKELIYECVCKKDPTGDRLNVLFLRVGDDSGILIADIFSFICSHLDPYLDFSS